MPKGFVTLVGAGPGDPGLLTLAGREALAQADVVLFDRLAGDEILALIPPSAEMIDVGKHRGNHPVPQDAINALLCEHAERGKNVVRLKGGDPFLFGRGGEELEQVQERGIPFRVIPGITSALAAPAYAGIPVTHRNYSSSVHILTGHGKEGGEPAIPYAEIARLGGTLALMMSIAPLAGICARLQAEGMAPDVPAAVVENGTRPSQRVVRGTLATIADMALNEAVASPAVVVIGKVCALADTLEWTRFLPLSGVRVLAVSSAQAGSRLAGTLRRHGCMVDEFAGIRMEPRADAAGWEKRAAGYQWIILTSQYGADLFFSQLASAKIDIRSLSHCNFAVVGERTAQRLTSRGIFPDCMPEAFSGEELALRLAAIMRPDERALLYRAENGNQIIADTLAGHGLAFDVIKAYRTINQPLPVAMAEKLSAGKYTAITLTSASAVHALAQGGGGLTGKPALCIGAMTARAAEQYGMDVTISPVATIDSMVETLLAQWGKICE